MPNIKTTYTAVNKPPYRCYIGMIEVYHNETLLYKERTNINRILIQDALNDAEELRQDVLNVYNLAA